MSRNKQFHHVSSIKLSQVDRALLEFYARKYNTDKSKVVRSMVRRYITADASFDPKEFKRFVESHLAPACEDKDIAGQMKIETSEFVKKYPKR